MGTIAPKGIFFWYTKVIMLNKLLYVTLPFLLVLSFTSVHADTESDLRDQLKGLEDEIKGLQDNRNNYRNNQNETGSNELIDNHNMKNEQFLYRYR